LQLLFRRDAKDGMSNVELITISRSLFGNIEGLNQVITYERLLEKLNLQILSLDDRGDLLYKVLKRICNWPCLSNLENIDEKDNNVERTFSLYEILVLVSIFNGKALQKIGMKDDYFIHLIFILLISTEDMNYLE
ncbi:hypothetical protein C6P40_005165, partial [Pichia californica]